MSELRFDTGLVNYKVNGVCDIAFNPTDTGFAEKIYAAFETLEKKQQEYNAEMNRIRGTAEIFDFARRIDLEMREMIDGVFGPVCDKIFGQMNVYAMANGLPVWCNFMMAIIEVINETAEKEKKAMNPRVKKYMDKYGNRK